MMKDNNFNLKDYSNDDLNAAYEHNEYLIHELEREMSNFVMNLKLEKRSAKN